MTETDFHIVKKIRQNVRDHADRSAMQYLFAHQWHDISWADVGSQLDSLSLALLSAGIQVQEKIGIMATNEPRWTLTDIAAMQVRAVVVPIYPTSPLSQAEYIARNADIKVMFVNGQDQLDMMLALYPALPMLERIVVMNDELALPEMEYVQSWQSFIDMGRVSDNTELNARLNAVQQTDLFTLIYTSGTTGEPKGVMLNHHNLNAQLFGHDERINITTDDVSLCFLPLSHVFERAWSLYVLYKGAKNCYLQDVRFVREALQQVAPHLMCAVPRFYEKIHSAIHEKVSHSSWLKRTLFHWALKVGGQVTVMQQKQRRLNPWLALNHALADRLVLSKLRDLLGGRIRLMPCGGAKLDAEIGRFFHAIGINVKLGYGMTETTATISCWSDHTFDANSIGDVMPNVAVKIGADNEILVKGPIVMQGYYKLPQATHQAFVEEG
ncbi:MAG: AMP-dependent synthetase/ligase, partial [Vibrio sp.]